MSNEYRTIEQLLEKITEPYRTRLRHLHADNEALFAAAYGSSHNHQAWRGGYLAHVEETMNVAIELYRTLNDCRPLPFTLSDALVVLYLHDIEKPWKYALLPNGTLTPIPELRDKTAQREFRNRKLKEYGIDLTPLLANGLQYVEGEGNDYDRTRRVMNPLAAFCHLCDVTSAHIWFDCPNEHDGWSKAKTTDSSEQPESNGSETR